MEVDGELYQLPVFNSPYINFSSFKLFNLEKSITFRNPIFC